MSRANTKIKPSEWYTLSDLVALGVFPWVRSFSSVRKIVGLDMKGKNLLKPNITGTGVGKKYHFKGQNIINFINKMEAGNVHR